MQSDEPRLSDRTESAAGDWQPPRVGGASLERDERKNATILFADIVGSTAMVATRDPEAALDILRPALGLLSEAVQRYGGTVNRVTGDGLMALFGAPFTDEEHALGACCAALEMHASLARSEFDIPLRVGIHSGEIVVHQLRIGTVHTLDAAGEAVHLAARLQQDAPSGSTWISDATFALARGRVETRIVGPQPFRGFELPVVVHVLQAADASLSRLDVAGRRGLSPFVNRRAELDVLEAAYMRAAAGQGCAVALVGDPGVGKSRLVREFVAARSGARVLEARCTRWRDDSGFHAMRVLTRRLLGLDTTENAGATHARLEMASVAPGTPPAEALAAVAVLQGVMPPGAGGGPVAWWAGLAPNARRRRIIEGCLAVLLAAASDKPLLVVVDDIHWADSGTYEVIERLLDAIGKSRLLLLLGWRAGYRFGWSEHSALTHVALSALSPANARDLARSVLGQRATDNSVVAGIADRTGGNPFFIEEAAAMPDPALVPPTVGSIIGARLDALKPEEKRFIEVLATVGEPTSAELLANVLDADEGGAQVVAAELERAGLLRIDGVGETARIACRHSLLQEVAYRGLIRTRRRALHGQIAVAMERLAGERVADEAEVLARHARLGGAWEAALRHARAAGARAASHSANREAVRFYEEALEALAFLPEGSGALEIAVDLRFALRESLFRLGQIAALQTRLSEAAALAEKLGDVQRLGQLYRFQGHHAWLAGDYTAALAAAQRAATLAETHQDAALALVAVFARALGEFGQGNLAASAADMAVVAERAEDPALGGRFGLDTEVTVVALGYRSRALADLGQFDAAARAAEACAERAAQLARPFASIFAALAEGYLLLARGATSDAARRLAEALQLCDRAQADLMRPVALSFLGAAEAASGSVTAGIEHLELAVRTAADMGFLFQQPLRLALLSEALCAAGRSNEAAERAAEALALATSQGERFSFEVANRAMARARSPCA